MSCKKIVKNIIIAITFFILFLFGIGFYFIPDLPKYEVENYYLHKNQPISKINNLKPVYFYNGWLYCSDGNTIVKTNDYGKSFVSVASIEHSKWYLNILKHFYLTARIARLDVYRMRILTDGTIVLTTKEGVFVKSPDENTAKLSFKTKGSRPISLCVNSDNVVYFGEYHSNPHRGPMSIFASNDGGKTFNKIYTFPAKTIRHVHSVEYDKYENCLWISTGDNDTETYLLKASLDCGKIETIAKGGQENRYFEIKVSPDKIFMTPDSPNGNNAITIYDKKEKKLKRILPVEAPIFFSAIFGDYYFVGTSNEPCAKDKCEYLTSHIYAINVKTLKTEKIGIFGTDVLYRASLLRMNPIPGLFQYSQAYFPEGEYADKTKLVIYGNGLAGFWNDAYIWDISNLNL